MGKDTNKTRITTVGGNPTIYGNQSARIRTTLNNGLILTPDGSTGTAHILYDDGRLVTYDNSGDEVPVAEEYVDYWRKAFNEALKNALPNLLLKGVHWLGDKFTKVGGWLNRFEDGGVAAQKPSQDLIMKELMAIVQQAATELQSNKPGQGVQTLAQIANDPQGSQLLDALVQQVPEAGQIVEAVMKMVGAFKCGGKTKKKVKKGAKGCVPCKKLMRVGGKLINVWSDCEGNIISKHQVGGRFIPKAEKGFTDEQLAMLNTDHNLDWALKQNASTSMKQGVEGTKYYLGNDGKTLYSTTSGKGADGNYYWNKGESLGEIAGMSEAKLKEYGIVGKNGKYTIGNTWDAQGNLNTTNASALTNLSGLGNAYTTTTTASGPIQYYDGTVWRNMLSLENADGTYRWVTGNEASLKDFGDDDMRTGLTATDLNRGTITADLAKTAGIDVAQFDDDKYQTSSNSLLGTKPDATTALNTLGSLGLARQLQRQKRDIGRTAWRNARAVNIGDRSTNVISTYKEFKNAGLTNVDHAGQVKAAIDAIYNQYKLPAPSNSSNTSSSVSGSTTATTDIKPVFKTDKNKQGGWLTKFN